LGLLGQCKNYNTESPPLREEAYGHTFSGQLRVQVKTKRFPGVCLGPLHPSIEDEALQLSHLWFLTFLVSSALGLDPVQSLKLMLPDSPDHQRTHSTAPISVTSSLVSAPFIVELRDFLYSLWISVTHLQRQLVMCYVLLLGVSYRRFQGT